MLKYRLLTAGILIPLVVWAIFGLSADQFGMIGVLVFLYAAWEWLGLCGISHRVCQAGYMLLFLCALLAFYQFGRGAAFVQVIVPLSVCWWLLLSFFVLRYPNNQAVWTSRCVRALMGWVTLLSAYLALLIIFMQPGGKGSWLLLFLFLIIWGADSGAYFAGKAFGRHKLIPKVSPGKTWEGFAGAMVVVCILSLLGAIYLLPTVPAFAVFLWFFLTAIFSILGDLFESMLKRAQGLKDSGHFLPGHGGLLDRIDSLLAAAPVFVYGYWVIQRLTA